MSEILHMISSVTIAIYPSIFLFMALLDKANKLLSNQSKLRSTQRKNPRETTHWKHHRVEKSNHHAVLGDLGAGGRNLTCEAHVEREKLLFFAV